MEATPGFGNWGAWPLLGAAAGVLAIDLFVVLLVGLLLLQVLLLERPRWRPWRWTTPWLFPREWRE